MKSQTIIIISAALLLAPGCGEDPVPQAVTDSGASDVSASDGGLTDAQGTDALVFDSGLSDASQQASPCANAAWTLLSSRVELTCGAARLTLTPSIHADGAWRDPTNCQGTGNGGLECGFSGFGRLELTAQGSLITSRYISDAEHEFGGHGLKGIARIPGADAWLSNGFQSWSQSGVIAVPERVSEVETDTAIRSTGDIEVIRNGVANSWWHTFVRGENSMVLGATTAERFKSWLSISGVAPNLSIRLSSGGTGESLQLPSGRVVEGETWFLDLTDDINESLNHYGRSLPSRDASAARPEAGWNSWYELWDTVDEEAVRANAALVAEHLTPRVPAEFLPLRIVVDDGWQRDWGEWTANEKFPSGLNQLVTDLRTDGFHTGIWLAPLLVKGDLPLVAEHPDWFVEGASFTHLRHGVMKILDVTHPGAADHLRGIIRSVVGHGFDLLKIDFLFAGTYEGQRLQRVTGMEAYNRAIDLIREAAGPETVILSVGSPPIAGFDKMDVWRIGPDVAVQVFDATWFFVPGVARTTASRWPYCRAILCDGDPPLLRRLPQNEVNVAGWAAAFAGSALFLSDDLRTLPPERWDWLTPDIVYTALAGEPSIPDPVPPVVPFELTKALADQSAQQSRHEVPVRWALPNGDTVYVNWSDNPMDYEGQRYSPRSAQRVSPP